jgi:hypothetical protein
MLLKPSGWMRLALTAGLALTSLASSAADPEQIGLLEDASGNFALATIPKIHATQLAVAEINAKGGILGRPAELIAYDTQSDNTKFQELARHLVQTDKPDVIFGAFSSASREAIRPIMDRAHQLYWYDNQYEGGVCDTNPPVEISGLLTHRLLFVPAYPAAQIGDLANRARFKICSLRSLPCSHGDHGNHQRAKTGMRSNQAVSNVKVAGATKFEIASEHERPHVVGPGD